MTQHLFNGTEAEQRRKMEAMLLEHHADIQRLWKRINQFPRDSVGELPHAENATLPPQGDEEA